MDLVRQSGITNDYLANSGPRYLECFWQKGKWRQVHGNGKARLMVPMSMKATTAPPEYRTRILYLKKPTLDLTLPENINKDGTTNSPTPWEVIDAIEIELTKMTSRLTTTRLAIETFLRILRSVSQGWPSTSGDEPDFFFLSPGSSDVAPCFDALCFY